MLRHLISNMLGLVGAAVGGVLGFYTFRWLWGQGFYGLMIPGALLGLGCSLLARHTSIVRGVLCGIAALGLALFTEWWFRPFAADDSLQYFLVHVKDLNATTLLMTVVGALIAYWVGKDGGLPGYSRTSPPPSRSIPEQESRGTG
jgi:Ca2+/Na+ antiporter